ncbi:MAG: hypothetical protein ABF335_01790 [Alphaproteobacteria bacterium]
MLRWSLQEFQRHLTVKRNTHDLALSIFSYNIARTLKTSDTLFILGSGASINELTDADWRKVKSCDSMGLNFWLAHQFVPNFFMFEESSTPDRKEKFNQLLAQRLDDYQGVTFLYKDIERNGLNEYFKAALAKRRFYVVNKIHMPIFGHTEHNIATKAYAYLQRLGLTKRPMFARGSITVAMAIGSLLGYKKIILLGVDLNNVDYFWDSYSEEQRINSGQPYTIHKTASTEYGPVTIIDAVHAMNRYLLQPQSIDLYIGSKSSALYPDLPYYFKETHD